MKNETPVVTNLKVGDKVKILGTRKESGQVGSLKVVRHSEHGYHFIVFFEDGDANDFKEEQLEKV
jgi:hypothetical protein